MALNSFYPAPEGTSGALVCPTNLLTAILREWSSLDYNQIWQEACSDNKLRMKLIQDLPSWSKCEVEAIFVTGKAA